jgi:RNA polymerase sigma factor (sigma-70 family)
MTDQLLRAVRRWADRHHNPVTDTELLTRFAAGREAEAFERLVGRYGPFVWAVCRRMLPNDPDDAFQATFLALARSAGRIRVDRTLSGWLHGTAVRVCLKVRQTRTRQFARERATARPEAVTTDPSWETVQAAVHEEIERLPTPLRVAFVICELEGIRPDEAAARLGWKAGTLSGRLCKARQVLRTRLVDRGLTPVAAVGIVSIGGATVEATVHCPTGLAMAVLGSNPGNGPGVSDLVLELARAATEGTMAKGNVLIAGLLAVGMVVGGGWIAGQDSRSSPDSRPGTANTVGGDTPPKVASRPNGGWEYLFVGQPKAADLPAVVSRYGGEGWELVTVLAMTAEDVRAAAAADPKRVVGAEGATALLLMKRPVGGTGRSAPPTPSTRETPDTSSADVLKNR